MNKIIEKLHSKLVLKESVTAKNNGGIQVPFSAVSGKDWKNEETGVHKKLKYNIDSVLLDNGKVLYSAMFYNADDEENDLGNAGGNYEWLFDSRSKAKSVVLKAIEEEIKNSSESLRIEKLHKETKFLVVDKANSSRKIELSAKDEEEAKDKGASDLKTTNISVSRIEKLHSELVRKEAIVVDLDNMKLDSDITDDEPKIQAMLRLLDRELNSVGISVTKVEPRSGGEIRVYIKDKEGNRDDTMTVLLKKTKAVIRGFDVNYKSPASGIKDVVKDETTRGWDRKLTKGPKDKGNTWAGKTVAKDPNAINRKKEFEAVLSGMKYFSYKGNNENLLEGRLELRSKPLESTGRDTFMQVGERYGSGLAMSVDFQSMGQDSFDTTEPSDITNNIKKREKMLEEARKISEEGIGLFKQFQQIMKKYPLKKESLRIEKLHKECVLKEEAKPKLSWIDKDGKKQLSYNNDSDSFIAWLTARGATKIHKESFSSLSISQLKDMMAGYFTDMTEKDISKMSKVDMIDMLKGTPIWKESLRVEKLHKECVLKEKITPDESAAIDDAIDSILKTKSQLQVLIRSRDDSDFGVAKQQLDNAERAFNAMKRKLGGMKEMVTSQDKKDVVSDIKVLSEIASDLQTTLHKLHALANLTSAYGYSGDFIRQAIKKTEEAITKATAMMKESLAKCSNCNGEGEIENGKTCPLCQGTGGVVKESFSSRFEAVDWARKQKKAGKTDEQIEEELSKDFHDVKDVEYIMNQIL